MGRDLGLDMHTVSLGFRPRIQLATGRGHARALSSCAVSSRALSSRALSSSRTSVCALTRQDNSDVTFNVCLGRDFDCAGLTFCGHMGHAEHRHFSYRHHHVVGECIVHLGRRRHGACPGIAFGT